MDVMDLALKVIGVHGVGPGDRVMIRGSKDVFRVTDQRREVGLVVRRIRSFDETTGRYSYHEGEYRLESNGWHLTGEAIPVGMTWAPIKGGSYILRPA